MGDVKETRTPARFIEPGKRAAGIDLNSAQVNQFIELLKEHHTVIDPTMAVWEATYVDRPGNPSHEDALYVRLPAVALAGAAQFAGARWMRLCQPPIPRPTNSMLRIVAANFMVRMVKKLYDNNITVVAGTDLGMGYSLHRELEIYNQAGIPAPLEVLRMATYTAAKVMKKDGEFGVIAPGKMADLVLVETEIHRRISVTFAKIETVIKGGAVMYPSELYPAMGIRAQ